MASVCIRMKLALRNAKDRDLHLLTRFVIVNILVHVQRDEMGY